MYVLRVCDHICFSASAVWLERKMAMPCLHVARLQCRSAARTCDWWYVALLQRVLDVNGETLLLSLDRPLTLLQCPIEETTGKTVIWHSDNMADPAELLQHDPVFNAFRVSSSPNLCELSHSTKNTLNKTFDAMGLQRSQSIGIHLLE